MIRIDDNEVNVMTKILKRKFEIVV